MRKIIFDNSEGSLTIPAASVSKIPRASDTALRLLLLLAADTSVCEDIDAHADGLCDTLACTRTELDMALAFWCGAGVMDILSATDVAKACPKVAKGDATRATAGDAAKTTIGDADRDSSGTASKKSAKLMRAAGVPEYTSEELGAMLENDHSSLLFVDESQRRIGRILTPREVSILMGLRSYLELEDEYIFILLDHCRTIGKTSIRYVETTTFGLYDDGICDTDALAENLTRREAYASLEARFKVMVGARGRKLSPKETRFLNHWSVDMKYGFEMIELAYNITIDTRHEYNPAYMNGILERWFASAITTPEAVRADCEAHRAKGSQTAQGSFDTDEFLEAALRRSYSDG